MIHTSLAYPSSRTRATIHLYGVPSSLQVPSAQPYPLRRYVSMTWRTKTYKQRLPCCAKRKASWNNDWSSRRTNIPCKWIHSKTKSSGRSSESPIEMLESPNYSATSKPWYRKKSSWKMSIKAWASGQSKAKNWFTNKYSLYSKDRITSSLFQMTELNFWNKKKKKFNNKKRILLKS